MRVMAIALLCGVSIGVLEAAPAAAQDAPSLAQMSDVDIGVLATNRFTEYPERACPAAEEYLRRGIHSTKETAIRETVAPYCRRNGHGVPKAGAAAPVGGGGPPVGRYVCLRMGNMQNAPADDLIIGAGNKYTVAGTKGQFARAGSSIQWTSGAWATGRTGWVARYDAPGPTAKYPTIVLRLASDVAAGNKRDLQWCNLAQ